MSGARGKAVEIAGAAGIIAEVDKSRIKTRYDQGWVSKVTNSPVEAYSLAQESQKATFGCAIAFHGNIVELLEHAVSSNIHIDLLSDQTSCHAVYEGDSRQASVSKKELATRWRWRNLRKKLTNP